jgi:PTH2 family peptidyl-tRNA hydrolase
MKRKPSPYKQVFVIRKDLGMDAGKIGSQTAHAMHLSMFGETRPSEGEPLVEEFTFVVRGPAAQWLQKDFPKMTLEVYSEQELLDIHAKALAAGLPCGLVEDNGWTVFKNKKTATVVGIGPAESAEIDKITGHLKKYLSTKAEPA